MSTSTATAGPEGGNLDAKRIVSGEDEDAGTVISDCVSNREEEEEEEDCDQRGKDQGTGGYTRMRTNGRH